MRKISLIFPMAGQGARFGYRFKPFLDVQQMTFIEAAFAPFRPHLPQIAKVYFVFTAEQNRAHNVRARLDRMFADVPHDTAILAKPTDGPAQTLDKCLEMKSLSGPIMVCDCDHAVNVDALMQTMKQPHIECAVPTWDIKGEPLTSWSVAAVQHDGRIAAIAEKALPKHGEDFRGVIGCYYFSDATQVRRFIEEERMLYLSDVVGKYLAGGRAVLSVPVNKARFFGDPARLAALAG